MTATEMESSVIAAWLKRIQDEAGPDPDTCLRPLPQPGVPASFQIGDSPANAFFERATATCTKEMRADRTVHRLVFRDAVTALECEVELSEYAGFPALEWVLNFRNIGSDPSPIIEDVRALDLVWPTPDCTPRLHRSPGAAEKATDFQFVSEPMATIRSHQWSARMTAGSEGRSSVTWLPFFNLESGEDGLLIAIGWSGQWTAEVTRNDPESVCLRAGMELTRLRLLPGESMRTPRILALYWRGAVSRGQNLLRALLLRRQAPQQPGQPPQAPACCGSWGGSPTATHLETIRKISEHRLPYDYYWVDAGWYGMSPEPCANVFEGASWWQDVGDWRVNPHRHPDGLKPVSDAAHAAGMKFLLWVEPERAPHGAPVTLEHPDWFLGLPGKPRQKGDNLLLDLGNPEARAWVTDLISRLITENGIDCYRQDFNMQPLPYWRGNDPPERQGMTEIRHVAGLYAFWDDLLARHPGLLIDNCASGGRRIDLETAGRSIPLWRDDYNCFPQADPEAIQVHGAGLSNWIPLHATSPVNTEPGDTYRFRSALSPGIVFTLDEFALQTVDEGYPWAWHRQMLEDYRRVQPFWSGDYYALTTCSAAPDAWLAWQVHRCDLDAGAILIFRRAASPFETAIFPLHALDSGTRYVFEDVDTGDTHGETGDILGQRGLRVTIQEQRSSRLLMYRAGRVRESS